MTSFVLQLQSMISRWHRALGRARGPVMSTNAHSACKSPPVQILLFYTAAHYQVSDWAVGQIMRLIICD